MKAGCAEKAPVRFGKGRECYLLHYEVRRLTPTLLPVHVAVGVRHDVHVALSVVVVSYRSARVARMVQGLCRMQKRRAKPGVDLTVTSHGFGLLSAVESSWQN